MSTSCRCCGSNCVVFSVVASLIIGIITAFLRITAAITLTPAFLWVTLGIAVVYLAVTIVSASIFRDGCCNNLCSIVTVLLAAILGTALFSIILLAIEFAATSVIGAIIAGGLLFFLFLILTSTACLIRCFFNCND